MKITPLETPLVGPHWVFPQVYTDTDLIGYGEPMGEFRAPEEGPHPIGLPDDDGREADG